MKRRVQPEYLDSLDFQDPEARKSRCNLLTINRAMGNFRWIKRTLRAASSSERRLLEIGAGDGALASRLLTKSSDSLSYTGVDLAPAPPSLPKGAAWRQTDLLTYSGYSNADVLVANLILHHFEKHELIRLGKTIRDSSIRRLIISEPHRRTLHKYQVQAGRLAGFNRITLHDARVSIDAGFRGGELPELLGLNNEGWSWRTEITWLGAYRLEASR
ncbi:MAG: class I SAM-dependent methyltransferase [Opitutales bacterium]